MRRLILPLLLSVFSLTPLLGEPPKPRPVVAWASGPLEVRVAFDGPVDVSVATSLEGRSIPFGEPDPKDGNRLASTDGKLGIAAASLVDGNRTLVLAVDPHPRDATYLLALPGIPTPIGYRPSGVEAVWEGDKGESWSGWLPGLDIAANRKALAGSVEHEKGLERLTTPGKLTLRTLLAFPPGKTTVRLVGNAPIAATLTAEGSNSVAMGNSVVLSYESTGEAVDLAVTLTTGVEGKPSTLNAAFQTAEKPGENALNPDHLVLPWVPLAAVSPAGTETTVPDLSGGDPIKGEAVFRSAESKCTTCHKLAGQGGEVGPALDSVAGRDRAWIYRSIALPSVEIHPEFVPYTVALKDGRIAAGIVRALGPDSIRVLDAEGKPTVVPKAEIEELRPSGTSIMPVGLEGAIGPEKMKDLVAYLAGSKPIGPGK